MLKPLSLALTLNPSQANWADSRGASIFRCFTKRARRDLLTPDFPLLPAKETLGAVRLAGDGSS
jgi:hypothetical protein